MDNQEIIKEKEYLASVLKIIEAKICGNEALLNDAEKSISENLKYAWDNKLEDYEWAEVKLNINRKEATEINAKNRLVAFNKMKKSAYFARIDFDDGEEVTPIYIGIATLEDNNYFYVYDWRAPISGMFYDFELGEASYLSPNGKVSGKITLKRQYKIENGKIVQMFDTSLQIVDNILQEMLASHASVKMRNIVTTIQKEQNKIIRRLDSDILIVSGPAGSGKTSVAMHRVAYLLYAYKESLNNSNVLILGPNEIFANFVSNVLPEIGEDNVYQTNFGDFISAFLTEFKIKENINDIYELTYKETGKIKSKRYNSIKLKMGMNYINIIETYLSKMRAKILSLQDIVINQKVIIEKAYLEKFADEIGFNGLTFKEQAIAIIEKILLHVDIKFNRDKSIKNVVKKQLVNNFNKIKSKDLYLGLYSNKKAFVQLCLDIISKSNNPENAISRQELEEIFDLTHESLKNGVLPFEDVSGYLYLKDRLTGFKTQANIKQVVIDEGQDYSLMQYRILSHVFKNAKITVLGDPDQCILPFEGAKNFNTISNILKQDRLDVKSEIAYLTKTYRSTSEICAFSRAILGEKVNFNQVERHGEPVSVVLDSPNLLDSQIIKDALNYKKQGNSVSVITKTEEQAWAIKNELGVSPLGRKFKVVSKKDRTFNTDKILIIPAYLSKGLEFDVALVYNAEKSEYPREFTNLFYVACTRALHILKIYYTKKLTEILAPAKNNLQQK